MSETAKLTDLMNNDPHLAEQIIKHSFADRLRELREEKKLSQNHVAAFLNIPVSTYANWEQARREPSIFSIYKIILLYGITADELFDIDIE